MRRRCHPPTATPAPWTRMASETPWSIATPSRRRRALDDDLPRHAVDSLDGAGWRASRDPHDPGCAMGSDSRETTDPNRPGAGEPLPSPTRRFPHETGRCGYEVRGAGAVWLARHWWIVGVALIHVEHRMPAWLDGPLPSPTALGPCPRIRGRPCRRPRVATELADERDGEPWASPDRRQLSV